MISAPIRRGCGIGPESRCRNSLKGISNVLTMCGKHAAVFLCALLSVIADCRHSVAQCPTDDYAVIGQWPEASRCRRRSDECPDQRTTSMASESSNTLRAIVSGATGAIGKNIVGELLASPRWGSVITVGRRPVDVPAQFGIDQKAEEASGRLQQHIVDMENLDASAALLHNADAHFCALGSTRKDAGSAVCACASLQYAQSHG